jgi:ABC-type transport system involved in multi-copper enzyme maturation permease subunit
VISWGIMRELLPTPLIAHSLRRRRGLIAALSLVLAAFQVFMILTARAFEEAGTFRQISAIMPAFVAQWTNMAAASFSGFVLFGYSHPIVLLFLIAVAVSIGTEPVGEIETRFVDVMLARPVPRLAVIVRTLVTLVLVTAIAAGSMLIASWLGLKWLTPPGARPPAGLVVLSLAANLSAIVLAWGAVALAIGCCVKRRATAAAAAGFLAFGTFVLDYSGKFWEAVRPYSRISPFHYFDPFAMIGGRALRTSDLLALGAMFTVSAVVAGVVYVKRDL